MRESKVESAHRDAIRAQGGLSFKFTSPGRVGVPDRIDLLPVPLAVRDLVAQYIRFTECKAPGKKPRPEQLREHSRLRALGFRVDVVDSIPEDLFT